MIITEAGDKLIVELDRTEAYYLTESLGVGYFNSMSREPGEALELGIDAFVAKTPHSFCTHYGCYGPAWENDTLCIEHTEKPETSLAACNWEPENCEDVPTYTEGADIKTRCVEHRPHTLSVEDTEDTLYQDTCAVCKVEFYSESDTAGSLITAYGVSMRTVCAGPTGTR